MNHKQAIKALKRSWHESEDLEHDEVYGIIELLEKGERVKRAANAVNNNKGRLWTDAKGCRFYTIDSPILDNLQAVLGEGKADA